MPHYNTRISTVSKIWELTAHGGHKVVPQVHLPFSTKDGFKQTWNLYVNM